METLSRLSSLGLVATQCARAGGWKGGNGTHVANAGAIFNELEAEHQATKILIAL